ncbi:histone-lysine N-methyltransferase SETMAR-like [Macrosteles quadrilineatus]|uniref:histone-lysine N-methyltransferase SETMAR-like n=1 Tax=Macrosteles quadrilineatus TaxID=74068 RepID=UPI0023E1336E|nr:histone-lysine N-methyltransferase SETMAR-like [Macrosteles quadrilineatus]
MDCGNRLVQFGPRRHLLVFETDVKGFGLKTDVFVDCGSFVCEYAGELISREEAKRRSRNDSINYIFVLIVYFVPSSISRSCGEKEHYVNSTTETIVDPTCVGNIGRYIKHSCQPNAAIVPVRIDSPISRLAVFSVRDIQAGEEITYDYASGGSGIGKTSCLCGTAKCRGFLPFDKDLLN